MPTTEYISRFNVLPSNSAAVNGANLLNAIAAARSDKLSLIADEGDVYDIDAGVIELAYFQSCFLAEGPHTIFRHRGAGRFFSINGSGFNPTGGVNKGVFGGSYPIQLWGNPAGGTTDLLYCNALIDCRVKVRGRDAVVIMRLDGVGQAGSVGSELSKFEVIASPTSDQLNFAVQPSYGVLATNSYSSEFYLDIEGCGAGNVPAVYFDQSVRNRLSGSLQSNKFGGLFTTSTCKFNKAAMHNEYNGGDADFILHGNHEILEQCAAAGTTTKTKIYGNNCRIHDSDIWGAQVFAGATNTEFWNNDSLATNGGFSDAGTNTVVRRCAGVADKN